MVVAARGSRTFSQRLIGRIPRVELQANVAIGNKGQPLVIHVARPVGRSDSLPLVVYVYGGGWQHGNPDQGLWAIAGLALRGYVAAAIDYRLSHEAAWPAQIEDCKCCIRYLRAHADEYGLDRDRVGAVGPSAGGHLAAMLGTSAHRPELEGDGGWPEQRSDVQAVVDWSGPVDLLHMATYQGTTHSRETWVARMLGGPVATEPKTVRSASPLTYITPAAPPFLVIHGDRDLVVPPNQSQILDAALRAAGVPSRLVRLPKTGHGFLGVRATRMTAKFLDEQLKPARV
jgi:acetyl esterase/lipase